MDTKRFFLYFIVITALALAGCGGNGGGTAMTPTTPDPTPTPDPCPPGQVGTPPNCTDPAPTVAELFATAQTARANAAGAVTTAEQAVKDAVKYSAMIDVVSVRGDSMMAETNAQTVLDAKTAADGAVTTAETAESDLMTAEDDAAQYNNDALDSAIAAAIEVAQDAIDDATAHAKDNRLKTAFQAVTGRDEDDPMTAADHAKMVAMAVGEALGPDSNTDGSGKRVSFNTALTTDSTVDPLPVTYRPPDEAKYEQNDVPASSMTWEMIVGADKVMDGRISTAAANTKAVKIASIAGMQVTNVFGTGATLEDATGLPAGSNGNGDQTTTTAANTITNYMGIPGTVICGGTDCKAANGILTGSWYFTPTLAKEFYKVSARAADGTPTAYSPETQYARYGYWITGTNDSARIHVYAIAGADGADTTTGDSSGTATDNTGTGGAASASAFYNITTNNSQDSTATMFTDASATYSGNAIGLSLYKEFNADGSIADGFPQTGEFTADVKLTANFGATPSLGGRITNFQGDAVDSTWSVTLRDTGFTSDGTGTTGTFGQIAEAANAPAVGSATQGGIWTAQAYGTGSFDDTGTQIAPTVRPTGIFGHFNTHFTNGHAAGAYATRKD